MKKFKIVLFLCLAFVLTACAGKKDSISSEDLKKYGELSKTAISYFSEKDSDNFLEMTSPNLKSFLTNDVLEEGYKTIDGIGNIIEFGKTDGFYHKDEKTKEKHIVILQKVKYQKKEIIFTVNFNTDNEIDGFFQK